MEYGNTAALDMESYEVMYAVKGSTVPRPKGLVIKGVCDYADEEKSNRYQKFAAFNSAQLQSFCMKNF